MSKERKEMESSNPNNPDVKVLKDIIAKALYGSPPTQRLPLDMQNFSTTATIKKIESMVAATLAICLLSQ
jgi:hypothetical protein